MPASACVSTSSVWKTLVTASMLIKAVSSIAIEHSLPCQPLPNGHGSVQTDPVVLILRGHVRQDHRIAHLQSVHHFNVVHRAAPQGHIHALRFLAVRVYLEQRDLRARLPHHWPAYIH